MYREDGKDRIAELYIRLLVMCKELVSPNRDALMRRIYWAQSQMYSARKLNGLAFHSASLATSDVD